VTVFIGAHGTVKLRRSSGNNLVSIKDVINAADVNTSLNRIGLDTSLDNILTGDRVDISTTDARGLVCLAASAWQSATIESEISAYVNVNAAGGLRFFATFADAVNNNRSAELTTYAFAGAPIDITYSIRDVSYNTIGNVVSYQLNTDREALDSTTLSDKFRNQYAAGLISGSGTIDCLFDYTTNGAQETPLVMLQLIQRLDVGSEFECAFYLTDSEIDPQVQTIFYQATAMVTRSGVEVNTTDVIRCAIDFVTTGEIRILVGRPADYILKEDDDRITLEQSLNFLLQETDD
jgi:hypothetical protein